MNRHSICLKKNLFKNKKNKIKIMKQFRKFNNNKNKNKKFKNLMKS